LYPRGLPIKPLIMLPNWMKFRLWMAFLLRELMNGTPWVAATSRMATIKNKGIYRKCTNDIELCWKVYPLYSAAILNIFSNIYLFWIRTSIILRLYYKKYWQNRDILKNYEYWLWKGLPSSVYYHSANIG